MVKREVQGQDQLYARPLEPQESVTHPLSRPRGAVVDPHIPERFVRQVSGHLLANIGEVPGVPLILGVHGAPGTGKTYQVELVLKRMGVELLTISGGQLESENAGEPAQLIRETYCEASDVLKTKSPACVVFNDIDTGGGEWEGNTGTVNHQTVLGELMHLVDFPKQVGGRITRRVPIIMTGNDFTKLYEPLRRPGRMRLFEWQPSREERYEIVRALFVGRSDAVLATLASAPPELPISFYADLRSALFQMMLDRHYPTIELRVQAIHEVLQTRRPLPAAEVMVSDEDLLRLAAELASSFQVTSHLRPHRVPGHAHG